MTKKINTDRLIKDFIRNGEKNFKEQVEIVNELWGLTLKNKILEERIKRGGDHPTLIQYKP